MTIRIGRGSRKSQLGKVAHYVRWDWIVNSHRRQVMVASKPYFEAAIVSTDDGVDDHVLQFVPNAVCCVALRCV